MAISLRGNVRAFRQEREQRVRAARDAVPPPASDVVELRPTLTVVDEEQEVTDLLDSYFSLEDDDRQHLVSVARELARQD